MVARPTQRWVVYVSDYESKHAEKWPHLTKDMILAFLSPRTGKGSIEVAVSVLFQALVLGPNDLSSSYRLTTSDPYPRIEWNPVARHCDIWAGGLPAIAATKSKVWVEKDPVRWEPQFWPDGLTATQWQERMRERGLG